MARIAYLASDVVLSVQQSLSTESEFSHYLGQYAGKQIKNLTSRALPEILRLRQNADPLLSAFKPLQEGKLVSATTTSAVLVNSIPHLYKLAQHPIVLHVALSTPQPDFSDVSSIRQCGFVFLQSETLQDAQDMAVTAHAMAARSGKGVIHFFDPSNSLNDTPIGAESRELLQTLFSKYIPVRALDSDGDLLYVDTGKVATTLDLPVSGVDPTLSSINVTNQPRPVRDASPTVGTTETTASSVSSRRQSSTDTGPVSSVATSVEAPLPRPISSSDIFSYVTEIWDDIRQATGRDYSAVEYTGPPDAEAAVYVFGSTGVFVDILDSDDCPADLSNVGIITARLYRPWLGSSVLLDSIPKSIKKIAVLEQLRRKTTKWGPSFMDLLSSLNAGANGRSQVAIVQYRLGHIDASTAAQALRGIFQNLAPASSPRSHQKRRGHVRAASVPIQNLSIGHEVAPKALDFGAEQPQAEIAYLKILNQLFAQRLYIANQSKAANAGISASLAATPE